MELSYRLIKLRSAVKERGKARDRNCANTDLIHAQRPSSQKGVRGLGIRSGSEYRESLKDGRIVYIQGDRVEDVTDYAPFGAIVDTLANLYDLQHNHAALLTFKSPVSGQAPLSLLQAQNGIEVAQRARADEYRAEATYGLLGRLPDYVNALLTGLARDHVYLGRRNSRLGENALRYFVQAQESDWCITHTLVDPQVDRSKGAAAQADPSLNLHLVSQSEGGIVVSGARMLSTLAPFANEIWVGPSYPRMPNEQAYALCFALPIATPGLKLLCREPYGATQDRFDRPLSSRFDEGDALAIFDNVLVPWNRVFVAGDVETYNALFMRAIPFALLQSVIRATVKLRFLSGLAIHLAECIGRADIPDYQSQLGELLGYTELANGLVQTGIGEVTAIVEGERKAPSALMATLHVLMPHAQLRATEIIRRIGGSGLVMTPTAKDLLHHEIAQYVERYLQGKHVPAKRRIQLFKLAWDLIGEAFGSRQLQYELFYAGDPTIMRRHFYHLPSTLDYKNMVDRLLEAN